MKNSIRRQIFHEEHSMRIKKSPRGKVALGWNIHTVCRIVCITLDPWAGLSHMPVALMALTSRGIHSGNVWIILCREELLNLPAFGIVRRNILLELSLTVKYPKTTNYRYKRVLVNATRGRPCCNNIKKRVLLK